jgi:hypothetical protein
MWLDWRLTSRFAPVRVKAWANSTDQKPRSAMTKSAGPVELASGWARLC